MTGPVVVSRPTSTKDRPVPQMPPLPNKEDINATWEYLEFGINRVMNHFTSGIDMQSVSSVSLIHSTHRHVYLQSLLTMPGLSLWLVHGPLYVSLSRLPNKLTSASNHMQCGPQLLYFTKCCFAVRISSDTSRGASKGR